MTNYEQIAQEHERRYGTDKMWIRNLLTQLYSDKTHFVDELVQNADDNRSHCMKLRLGEKSCSFGMMMQFSEKMYAVSVRLV